MQSDTQSGATSELRKIAARLLSWAALNRGFIIIALLSLAVTIALSIIGNVVWYGDAASFFLYADGLQNGGFYRHLSWRSPAYPLAILATGTIGRLLFLQAVLAFLIPLLVHGAFSPFSRKAAFAAGLLSALSLTPWIFFKTIYQDHLFVFGLVLIAFLLARLAAARSTVWIVWSLAVALIFFGWVRPTVYAAIPVALVILLWRRERLFHAQLAALVLIAANLGMAAWKSERDAATSSAGRQLFYNAYLWSDGVSLASPAGQELRTRWVSFLESDLGHLQNYRDVYPTTEQEYEELFGSRLGDAEAFVDHAMSHPHVAYYQALWRAMDYAQTGYGEEWDPLLARVSAEEALDDPGRFVWRLASGYKDYVFGPRWRFTGASEKAYQPAEFDPIGVPSAIMVPEQFRQKIEPKWLAPRPPTDEEKAANLVIAGMYEWLLPACYVLMLIGVAGFLPHGGPLRLAALGVFAFHASQVLGMALLVDPQSRYQMEIFPLAVLGAGFGILRIALWIGALAPQAGWLQREALLTQTQFPERSVAKDGRRWPMLALKEYWPALAAVLVGVLVSIPMPQLAAPIAQTTARRIADIRAVESALKAYAADNGGRYPVSEGWQGYASAWGKSAGPNWIPELAGAYIPSLPRDPAMSEKPDGPQYIYSSNGRGFKLIAHVPGDCSTAVESHGVHRDPMRMDGVNGCWAYGVWTPGAEGL